MAALLTLLVLAAFVAVEVWLARRGVRPVLDVVAPPAAEPPPCYDCGGFALPADRRYHPGHTWARVLEDQTVEVGIDDYARALIGDAEEIELPRTGSTLLQGETGFRVGTRGRWAPLLSPVDGEVVAVNHGLLASPEQVVGDCYGRGWLCRVRARNLPLTLRNLLAGGVARRWMEEESSRLRATLEVAAGGVMADGGVLSATFGRYLDPNTWQRLVDRSLALEEVHRTASTENTRT